MKRKNRIAFTVAILMYSGALMAECVDGARNATGAEKRFVTSMKTALKTTVPATPQGSRLLDRELAAPPKTLVPSE